MPGKHKALAVMLLLSALALGSADCSSQMPRGFPEDSESTAGTASDGGTEEVLSGDENEDDFGRRDRRPTTVAGEVMLVVGYVAMVVGSAILPFFML